MKSEIERLFQIKLGRELTAEEKERVLRPRSLIAYEMIIETLNDDDLQKNDIERYINRIA